MRGRRFARPWRVILAASLLAATCTSPPPVATTTDADPDGEITTPLRGIPQHIDPHRSGGADQVRHSAMVFEALMTLDPRTLRPVPAAAKDHPRVTNDGTTYTFTLRDDLKYSDGSPVRAKDFAYALSRLCDPAVASPSPAARIIVGCQSLRGLDPQGTASEDLRAARQRLGIRASGDTEVVVSLTEPASYFLTTVAASRFAYPVRESDVMKAGATYGTQPSTFIGNGAFKLVEWKPNERLVFERNEHYRAPAKLKRWTKVVIRDELAFAAYRNNEIDVFGGVPSGRAASVGAYRDVIEADAELRMQVVSVSGGFTDFYLLNASRPPFTDKKVRQAFAKANDRGARFSTVAALSVIPPGRPGHDPGDTFQLFDAAQARELLRSSSFAGRPELSTVRITYPSADPQGHQIAEWLQQQVKRNLGVEIALESVDDLTLRRMFASPSTAPQIIYRRWIGDADPHDWLTATFHSSGDFARLVGYQNAEFDALVSNADREGDPERRADLYRRASRILSEEAPAIWQWWGPNTYLRKPRLRGVSDSSTDIEYGILRANEIYVIRKR